MQFYHVVHNAIRFQIHALTAKKQVSIVSINCLVVTVVLVMVSGSSNDSDICYRVIKNELQELPRSMMLFAC